MLEKQLISNTHLLSTQPPSTTTGVPVFSVVIKNSLIAGRVCTHNWALFWGSVFPYLLAWGLYQGTFLIGLLNWAGLFVNGMSAFVLPLVLTLEATYVRHACYHHVSDHHQQQMKQKQQEMVVLEPRELTIQRSSLYCDGPNTAQPDVVALIKTQAMGHAANATAAAAAASTSGIKDYGTNGTTATARQVERDRLVTGDNGAAARETDSLLPSSSTATGNIPVSIPVSIPPVAAGGESRTGAGDGDGNGNGDCVILAQLRRQEYANTVNALPAWLIPYRYELVVLIQISFLVIVVWSVITGSQ